MPRFARSIVLALLRDFRCGAAELTLPEGTTLRLGDPSSPVEARWSIRRDRFFQRCLWQGDIGFGEAYVERDWESADPTAVLTWIIRNLAHTPGVSGGRRRLPFWNLLHWTNRLYHWGRRNTRGNSRRNIRDHYDLSNEFYALFLDEGLTYSSAFFTSPAQSLHEAQEEKYRRLADRLQLTPGQRVLEIGCGWGGFALHAARHRGCHVTGLTLSRNQWSIARQRAQEAGLADRTDFQLVDYRDIRGRFDAIVSIEMIEAVGHDFLRPFFAQCHRLLTPRGRLGLQAILLPDSRYEISRRGVDWIQKHIFPGGQLPSVTALLQAATRTGDLYLHHLETFGLHYARTLTRWRDAFRQRMEEVSALGFDGRFCRKWDYYLCYCEAAFRTRNINVAQLVLARPNDESFRMPAERDQENSLAA